LVNLVFIFPIKPIRYLILIAYDTFWVSSLALARELRHQGVTVNAIAPYAVEDTGMFPVEQPSYQPLIDT